MATSTVGSLTEFKPDSERIETYLERVQLFFDMNRIKDDKQITVLLTVIGNIYALLSNLLALGKPREKLFQELSETA